MKNNQRKNKKSLVLVAMILMIGLVAGMGAMTYSKYITTHTTETQTATAAKWGFVITADATELFGTVYNEEDSDTFATVTETGNIVVKASSTAKVVAPGTKGSMTFTISGTAEVLAKFTLTIDADKLIHFNDDYYPIVWKLSDGTDEVTSTELATLSLAGYIDAGDTTTRTFTLSWEWAFDQGKNDLDTVIGLYSNYKATDADTIALINTAAGTTVTAEQLTNSSYDLEFAIVASVEQVQAKA